MNISMLIQKINQYGLNGFIQKGFQYLLGIHKYQEELDTLHYFLNEHVAASSLPPTKDSDARIMQQCDAALLAVFDKICKKYGLQYWLSWGTLLGAVRHKGFIPWDDDMDITMMRKDFDWLRDNTPIEFNEYGIDFAYRSARITLSYQHSKTGIWLDIFAADEVCTDSDFNSVLPQIKKYQKLSNGKIDNKSTSEQAVVRNKYIPNKGDNIYIIDGMEFDKNAVNKFLFEDIFPLTTLEFEGYQLMVPNDYKAVLIKSYGQSYMSLPNLGINHHSMGRAPLSTWAKTNNVNMYEIKTFLDEIYNKI